MRNRSRRKLEKKQKKAKRDRRAARPVSLAYRGNKYKTEELIPVIFNAEVGIYEAFVATGRRLTDHAVRSALEDLIWQLRRGTLPPLQEEMGFGGEPEEFIIWRIRSSWRHLFQTEPEPGRDTLIGVLRTILGSIEARGSISPTSRGYLDYIEGFLNEAGVSVQQCSPEEVRRPRLIQ